MRKLLFVIPALTGGGAERVMLHLLRNIDRDTFEPGLVLFEKRGTFLSELPPDIRVQALRHGKSRYGLQWLIFLKLARLLRREKPDAVVSFMWYPNVVTLLATFLSRTKTAVIISERTSTALYESRFQQALRTLAIRFFYPYADRIIVPSAALGRQLAGARRSLAENIRIIRNPVDRERIVESAGAEVDHPWYRHGGAVIVGIGRLCRDKGFSFLIKAVSLLRTEGIDCRLVLLGEGGERRELEGLVRELGLEGAAALPGFAENPYKLLARSTVFVLSSVNEGFPNALLEAMALGVPAVATRCPTGPDEIITDGEDGILVSPGDEKALAQAIKRLLLDEGLRKRLGEAGRKRAEHFRVEQVIDEYQDVVESVCAESAAR
ncbi:MAG: glycosyltransferase [Syntrophales bacterium]